MEEYILEIRLESETIFGSGESTPGLVDIEIQTDANGLPLLKGKTIKGKIREQADLLQQLYEKEPHIPLEPAVQRLFGFEGSQTPAVVAFSDAQLPPGVVSELKRGIQKGLFSENEVLKGLTQIRSMTSLDSEGVAAEGSLRSARALRKGLRFQAPLIMRSEPTPFEMGMLAMAITLVRQMGTMQNRGKGQVSCHLLKDRQDITATLAKEFIKEVSAQ